MAKSTSKNGKDQRQNGSSKNGAEKNMNQSSSNNDTKQSNANIKQSPSLLEKFFIEQLQDIYYAEQQIIKALPKMDKAATSEELKEAFQDHLHQTTKHVSRLEKVFKTIGKQAQGKKCEAIEGILKEAESIISDTKEGTATRDAALILAAQKVEHYEIATYGGLVQLAITVGLSDAADILDKTLAEEHDTDELLTEIAEAHINMEAENENNYSWSKNKEKMNTGEEKEGQEEEETETEEAEY
jgi:ferritin-like metal-binding protein YciE